MSVTIKIRDNGPLVVEGDFILTDAAGNEVPIVKKALCRCGGRPPSRSATERTRRSGFRVRWPPCRTPRKKTPRSYFGADRGCPRGLTVAGRRWGQRSMRGSAPVSTHAHPVAPHFSQVQDVR